MSSALAASDGDGRLCTFSEDWRARDDIAGVVATDLRVERVSSPPPWTTFPIDTRDSLHQTRRITGLLGANEEDHPGQSSSNPHEEELDCTRVAGRQVPLLPLEAPQTIRAVSGEGRIVASLSYVYLGSMSLSCLMAN